MRPSRPRKSRPERTSACMTRQQHATYRELLKRTGLHQSVFMDRLLQLGERRIFEIISPESPIPEAVPA